MAWGFSGTRWAPGYAISATDSALIAADIQTAGGNRDSGKYGLPNTSFVTLVPGALPGTSYTVTAASWASSVATITIGAHVIQVGQHFALSGVTPSGYNGADLVATAVTGTTVSYALTSNPGAWSSGGTVLVGGVSAANGMLAVDQNGLLTQYNAGWGVYLANRVGVGATATSFPGNLNVVGGSQPASNANAGAGQFRLGTGTGAATDNALILGVDNSSNVGWIQSVKAGTADYPLLLNPNGGNVGVNKTTPNSPFAVAGLATYANNAAAITGGLTAGDFYVVSATNPRQVAVVF